MLNAIDKKRRREQRLSRLEDVTIDLQMTDQERPWEQSELNEWLQQHTDLSFNEILDSLEDSLTSTDKQVLMLVLEGVRQTELFAEALGIDHLGIYEQRRQVKRAKDRLAKKLRRFGERIDKNE
jgi:N-acetylglutamate synthase/N-acetylornithine aminotransferase